MTPITKEQLVTLILKASLNSNQAETIAARLKPLPTSEGERFYNSDDVKRLFAEVSQQ